MFLVFFNLQIFHIPSYLKKQILLLLLHIGFINYQNNLLDYNSLVCYFLYTELTFFSFVSAPPGYLIKLDFRDYFEIENSSGCQHDFLEVRDGQYGYSDLLGIECPYKKFPQMFMSKDRYLWIHFKSDENIEYKGFKAVYDFVQRPENSSK